MRWRGVLALNQVLSRCDDVVEHGLLVGEIACLGPLLAVLAATPNVGDYINPALVQPNPPDGSHKTRPQVDAVATVSFEQSGIRAVELCSRAPDDADRN